ncbi:Cof-type HAD-IIB family hydrolase [Clostridium sp.]|uniref:Cof-type HAD-IIB family hydrolase n=1 Tax=Clostridium sp. TaxID=1506 RepID=UPI002FCB9DBA
MYKLLALDLDGTLLRDDSTISTRTKKYLQLARDKGVKIVLSTGRPLQGVMQYVEELSLLGDDDYVLAYNGCAVYNTKTLNTIVDNSLKGIDAKRIFNLAKSNSLYVHAFTKDCCYASHNTLYSDLEILHNKVDVKFIRFNNDISDNEDIIKIILLEEENKLDHFYKTIPDEFFEDYFIVRSLPHMLEFVKRGNCKSSGLDALISHIGIDKADIIACGDAPNDLDMIKFAGVGVAMGNSHPNVKKASDYITSSNMDDGIVKVIEKYIL